MKAAKQAKDALSKQTAAAAFTKGQAKRLKAKAAIAHRAFTIASRKSAAAAQKSAAAAEQAHGALVTAETDNNAKKDGAQNSAGVKSARATLAGKLASKAAQDAAQVAKYATLEMKKSHL